MQSRTGRSRPSTCRTKPHLAARAGIRRRVHDVRAARQQTGRALRQPGEVSPAKVSDRAAAAPVQRQRLPRLRTNTSIDEIEGTPITATTSDGARIHCEHVLIATHVPLQGKTGLAARNGPAVEAGAVQFVRRRRLGTARRGSRSALLGHGRSVRLRARRSPARPRLRHLRRRRSQDRTGRRHDAVLQPRSSSAIKHLLPEIAHHASLVRAGHRDQRRPAVHRRQRRSVSTSRTGFSGNGMTFGTLSAMMFADHVTGEHNPWAELFDPGRTKIKGGLWNYLKENKDYPYYLIRDRFAGHGGQSLRAIPRGHGEIIEVERPAGRRLSRARRRDARAIGDLHAHGLLRALQRRRAHMGLPMSWLAVQGKWRSDWQDRQKTPLAPIEEKENSRQSVSRRSAVSVVSRQIRVGI